MSFVTPVLNLIQKNKQKIGLINWVVNFDFFIYGLSIFLPFVVVLIRLRSHFKAIPDKEIKKLTIATPHIISASLKANSCISKMKPLYFEKANLIYSVKPTLLFAYTNTPSLSV